MKEKTMRLKDWPGWPVQNNPYGREFDEAARERMLNVSSLLDPILARYMPAGISVEMGPLFNPHISPKNSNGKIIYIEKDAHAVRWLKKNGTALHFDLNTLPKSRTLDATIRESSVDVVVVSHVLNYVDYRECLDYCSKILHPQGHLFISNITNHGAPEHFSEERPRNINEITHYLKKDYDIIERHTYASTVPVQKNKTNILVARRR